jgi:hypothetical protein
MDIYDLAERTADAHPDETWMEVEVNGRRYGFDAKRGSGLELSVDIYKLE